MSASVRKADVTRSVATLPDRPVFLHCFAPSGKANSRAMQDRAIIATGGALILGALLALSNWFIGLLIIAAGIFLVIWGKSREATEARVAELPHVGPAILDGLRYLYPLISPPAATPPEIVELQVLRDLAIHNLLNRNPFLSTEPEIDALDRDFRDWEASVSARLAKPPFLHTEKARFDTLGVVDTMNMLNPRLDKLLAMLKMKLDRLDEAIQGAQQRTLR
jgi:hypothetical protein